MPSSTRDNAPLWLPIGIEIALAALGFWTLWGFPYSNGLLTILNNETKTGALIPGPTAAPMRQTYTGIAPLDHQLTILVSFFYTAIDGNRGDVSLSFFGLGGNVLAAWVLITIESLRNGNQSRWFLTYTTLFGLLVALIGFACVAPLYFALHLYFSSTIHSQRPDQLLISSPLKLALAPASILLGFGLPSLIMCLPAPAILSFSTKQLWTGIQQGWPLWIAGSQLGLTVIVSALIPTTAVVASDTLQNRVLKNLRLLYLFALSFAVPSHLVPLGFSALAYLFPVLFAAPYNAQFQPSNLLLPKNPFSDYQAQTLADGALPFLQWDTLVGVFSVAVWAITVRHAGKAENPDTAQIVKTTALTAALAGVVGPVGAGVIAIWGRDESMLNRPTADSRAVAKKGKAN